MIEFQDVSKSFGKIAALTRINLRIERSKTTVLLGTSGCGKSTILRLICGLMKPDQGQLLINGESISSLDILTWRQKMGFVLQAGGLFPHLTVEDNIALMARYHRWQQARIKERLQTLLKFVHLEESTLGRYPSELSGGQRQRVSLMRSLMLDPDLILMDEPLGALDPITRNDLQSELSQIFNELHKTVIFVTHDMAEAAFLADHVVLLRQGNIVQQGSVLDLIQSPKDDFVQSFVHSQRSMDAIIRERFPL